MNRHAPAVHLDAVPDRRWRRGRQLCSLVVFGGCCAWSVTTARHLMDGAAWAVALSAGIAGLFAWPGAPGPTSALHWDGTQWRRGGQPCQVHLSIDLGRWLLLRIVRTDLHPEWLALSQDDHTAVWHALRCALYCGRPPPPTQTAGPGAVRPPDER